MANYDNSILRFEENGVELFTVAATGESAVSERGLSKMSGVPRTTIQRWFSDLAHAGVPKWLKLLCDMDLHLTQEIKKRGRLIKPMVEGIPPRYKYRQSINFS